ncbi:hypothetical protein Tco_1417954 [Tanacetum coccineum]
MSQGRDTMEEDPSEGSDETEPVEEDETAATPPLPGRRGARISALAAMIRMRDDIPERTCHLWRILTWFDWLPGHDARTIARSADRAKDVGYVRALQASEHKMMTSIKETDYRDIRLEIDVVRARGQLLERLETLESHMSRMEWQRQSAEDRAVRHMMRTHVLEARAQINTVEDTGAALTWWNGHNLKVRGNDVAAYTQRFQELAMICTKFLADETKKVDKYISGLPDNIHGNVMSARPKTLDDAIELANDLMDQKLRTYAERQNENKRKAMIRQEITSNNNPT